MNKNNPLTPEDEKDHFPCAVEWWCPEAFFKTLEDNKKWCFNASIAVGCSKERKVGAMLKTTLFDQVIPLVHCWHNLLKFVEIVHLVSISQNQIVVLVRRYLNDLFRFVGF